MATLNPYLSFRDNARQAMEFYQSVLGGELDINVFGEFHDMPQDPDQANLIMHAQLTTPDGLVLMASDTPNGMEYAPSQGMSVSLSDISEATGREIWGRLSDGATVTMPLDAPPWGGLFGMLVDRFGISWMISADTD